MFTCTVCRKQFKSKKVLKWHCRNAHYPCSICGKQFKSEKGAKKHKFDVHEQEKFKPPYPNLKGEWVLPRLFKGRKSFGMFKCTTCVQYWKSAHAQSEFKQGCMLCNKKVYPIVLWQNDWQDDNFDAATVLFLDDDEKPHDKERCEACAVGKCQI